MINVDKLSIRLMCLNIYLYVYIYINYMNDQYHIVMLY
jgi:hypothetical protein